MNFSNLFKVCIVPFCLIATCNYSYASDRELATKGDDVKLTIEDGYPCGKELNVKIETNSVGYYDLGSDELQRIIANTARGILGLECAPVEKIDFTGYTDGQLVFLADATKEEGWELWTFPTPIERLALFLSIREPDFFYLGTGRQVLNPFLQIPGIKDTFQYAAINKELERMAKATGDAERFREYLLSPERDFGAYSRLRSHNEFILTAISEYAPDLHAEFTSTYQELEPSLKDSYWSKQVAEITDNLELTIAEVVERAEENIELFGEDGYGDYVDERVSALIYDESEIVSSGLEDAELPEIAYSSDYVAGFPDIGQSTKLPKTSQMLSQATEKLVPQIQQRVAKLAEDAELIISLAGAGYTDANDIFQSGFVLASEFEDAGYPQVGEALISHSMRTVDEIVKADFKRYSAQIDDIDLDGDTAKSLQIQAEDFRALEKDFPVFQQYRVSVEKKLESERETLCLNLLRSADIRKTEGNLLVVVDDEPLSLIDLACNLFENDHRIEGFNKVKDGYELNISEAEGEDTNQIQFLLSKSEGVNGLEQLAVKSGASSSSADADETDWQLRLLKLVQAAPSGEPDQNGIRECDVLAADPDDVHKLTNGVDLLAEDIDPDTFERAIDACIAAVEHDSTNPRLNYQLGRLFLYAGEEELAGEYLGLSSQEQYPAAIYQQAERLLGQSDAHNNFVDAYNMFKKAGSLGYKPGLAMVKELNPEGMALYKEISPPTRSDTRDMEGLTRQSCTTFFGVQSCVSIVGANLKDCFQTSASQFECQYRPIISCRNNLSSFHNMIMAAACAGSEWGFGRFRKAGSGWEFEGSL